MTAFLGEIVGTALLITLGDQNFYDDQFKDWIKSTHFLNAEKGGILPLMYNSKSADGYDQRTLTSRDLKGLNINNPTNYGKDRTKPRRIGGQNTNRIPYEPR
jgi:hypothetical protein